MIKKLKIGLLIITLSLLVGVVSVEAAAGDITWSAAQTIDLTTMDLTIASGSTAESMVVGTTTLVPTLADTDVFTVSTATAGSLVVSPTTDVSLRCGSTDGVATAVITATGGQAYTITPSDTACGPISVGGGSSGGGGGSSTPPPVIPPVVLDLDGGCSAGNLYNTSTGALCVNNVKTEIPGCGNRTTGYSTASGLSCAGNKVAPASVTPSPSTNPTPTSLAYNFGTTVLKNGSKGEAVKELQKFLNAKLKLGLVLDGKLGPKTIAVIKKWQKDHGLVVDGLVGPKTKAMMYGEAQ